ncbi:MAG: Rieske (2Fe-2S) protein [Desulfarculaceae bacterium]|jgi:nitrite reductase/ring-hydroxylating ferredoxin subunit
MGVVDFLKALAGICETQPLPAHLWRVQGDKVSISLNQGPHLKEPDAAVYIKGQGLKRALLVLRDPQGRLQAFVNRCTHGGRKLDLVEGQEVLRCCSIGHSTFDLSGKRLSGPAKGPISQCPVEEKAGEALVSLP